MVKYKGTIWEQIKKASGQDFSPTKHCQHSRKEITDNDIFYAKYLCTLVQLKPNFKNEVELFRKKWGLPINGLNTHMDEYTWIKNTASKMTKVPKYYEIDYLKHLADINQLNIANKQHKKIISILYKEHQKMEVISWLSIYLYDIKQLYKRLNLDSSWFKSLVSYLLYNKWDCFQEITQPFTMNGKREQLLDDAYVFIRLSKYCRKEHLDNWWDVIMAKYKSLSTQEMKLQCKIPDNIKRDFLIYDLYLKYSSKKRAWNAVYSSKVSDEDMRVILESKTSKEKYDITYQYFCKVIDTMTKKIATV